MKNNKLLRRQKTKLLLYNLAAFLIIFFILGLAAVLLIDGYFYRGADNELASSREFLISINTNTSPRPDGKPKLPLAKNPRISYFLYDENKALLDLDLPDFPDPAALPAPSEGEKTFNQKIGGFSYRVLEFSFQSGQSVYYAQIVINIDGELALRNNIVAIYLICLAVIIVLIVAVSFIMSVLAMRPVVKAMETQTRFVSDASHELRTPLTALHCRLEHLLSCPGDRIIDKSEDISDCLSEVIRLTRLSEGLLSLAKSDADKVPPEISEFDIYCLINKVAAPYAEMAACQNKPFTVSGESVAVRADAKRMMQALIILFDNALKYTAAGDDIAVSVRKNKNNCEITVADTGIGVSEQGLPRIFERFYRDDFSRGVTDGSGLGLSIARQIAEEHSGSISARRNVPKGLKVTMVIPC